MSSISKKKIVVEFVCIGIALLSLLQTTFNLTFREQLIVKYPEWQNNSYADERVEWSKTAYTCGQLTSFLGGLIANHYGAGLVFGIGATLSAVINIVVGYLISVNFGMILLVKFIDGTIAAAAFSAIARICYTLSTKSDVSIIVAITCTGYYIAPLVDKWIIATIVKQFDLHQVMLQYIGIATAVWALLWLLLIKKLSPSDQLKDETKMTKSENLRTVTSYPWTPMLKCMPLWALCIVGFVYASGDTLFHSYLPSDMREKKYINDIDTYDDLTVQNLDFLTSLLVAGYMIDAARNKNTRTETKIELYNHKMLICLAFAALCLTLPAYMIALIYRYVDAETIYHIVNISCAFSEIVMQVNVIDLSPKYASLLSGIQRTFRTLGTILTTQLMKNTKISPWDYRLFCFSALYLFGSIIYSIFGSAKLQLWDDTSYEEHELKNQTNIATDDVVSLHSQMKKFKNLFRLKRIIDEA